MAQKLGLLPRPQEDETLSSFLIRLANNHSATPHELCAIVWPEAQFWVRDIDLTASEALIEQIAASTDIPHTSIYQMVLHDLAHRMGRRSGKSRGLQPGILPIGIYHRTRRRYGQQFCKDCLDMNPPYLRRQWRLEFATTCVMHGTQLSDACHVCDAPFIPHRHNALITRQCHQCQSSFANNKTQRANENALAIQHFLTNLAYRTNSESIARWKNTNTSATPGEWLSGIRNLCRLLTFLADGHGLRPKRSGLKWNFLRVAQREMVLSIVCAWLDDWPRSFLQWTEKYKISQERLKEYGPWPPWIQNEIINLPSRTHTRKRKASLSLRQLRRREGNTASYRMARAKLLLDRASSRGVRL
ncbi:MAG TPA: TniQ family protein [Pseudomonadales bacterium]|nr:TniQ family protein [Pseudomonadales bacterium]